MKKHSVCILPAVLAACILTACSGGSGSSSVDMSKLAEDLKGTVTSGELAEVSSDILASTYFLDMEKIAESTASLSSGATACEVAVVKCKDSAYTSDVESLFETRVENQAALFADYNAAEAAKLEDAIIESNGDYVVLCVTDDTDAAKKILETAGF